MYDLRGYLLYLSLGSSTLAATLYNGGQKVILNPGMSNSCDAAFNTTIDCAADLIQLVSYPMLDVGWNTTALTQLCTSQCSSSMSTLASNVQSGCSTETFVFNGVNTTYSTLMDYMNYKLGFVCLKDSSSGSFCLDVENKWNISQMVASGKATWPANPSRCYFDFSSGHNSFITDLNGTCIDPFDPYDTTYYDNYIPNNQMVAADYFEDRGGPIPDGNYGWKEALEYDEYPLEIQCSSCMQQNFKYGFTSKWGEPWDEMTEQIWENMKQNCKLTDTIVPAVNLTGRGFNATWEDRGTTAYPLAPCPRNITIAANLTCNQVAFNYQFALQSLRPINDDLIPCNNLKNTTICAPLSCPIAVVNEMSFLEPFVLQYTNFTREQFLTWNPSINTKDIGKGEVVCVGPPGGFYTPTDMAPAQPTVYTTTATATHPTQTGTIPNCGKYYTVVSGDSCNTVALKFSITFSDLINMNPSIDSQCTNLLAGYDYCVAPVNGTTVTPVTSTKQPASTTSSSSTSTSTASKTTTTSTSTSPVVTPTPTQTGMVSGCKQFYKAVSGDGCYDIAQRYGITLDQFVAWNPAVKSDCSGLFADYYYCVAT